MNSVSIHSLAAEIPLTKTYKTTREGGVEKTSYPNVWAFTSTSHSVRNPEQLLKVIQQVAADKHCLIKGHLNRPLDNESRAGSTSSYDETQWICLDIDKSTKLATPEQLLQLIGAGDVSYVVQYSSSYGIDHKGHPIDERLSCHIFILLDKPISAQLLKQWLFALNFEHLASETALTASGNSLSYTLDVTTCQNDKLLYVAPPILLDNTFNDQMVNNRIQLVKKKKQTLSIDPATIPTKATNYAKIAARVDELRAEKGMPKRSKTTTIKHHEKYGVTYLSKPDQATVTGVKQERGYIYLNLNGGDSWGYFFPEDNCEVVYNFKGEPNYLLKEIAPDFYAKRIREQRDKAQSENTLGANRQQRQQGRYYLAFRDFKSSDYFNGWYDYDTDQLVLNKAKNSNQLDSFLRQYGLELGEFVPDWNVVYDPHMPATLDEEQRIINTYKPSKFDYMELRPAAGDSFPTILKVIDHVLGVNQEEYPVEQRNEVREHFLNWVAYILQTKKPAGTTWVLHGVQGTGKGTFFHRILAPLFGTSNVCIKHAEDFTSQFNGWMANNVLCFVDEAHMGQMRESKATAAKLRTWLTDPIIDIREMYRSPYNAKNHNSFIFASNQVDAVIIPVNDRRFNVAFYQEHRWFPDEAEIARIDTELENFYLYLVQREANEELVRKIVNTSARLQMIDVGKLAIDEISERLRSGDLIWFFDKLPANEALVPAVQQGTLERYKEVLLEWVDNAAKNKRHVLRDHLMVVCVYLLGDVPTATYKFSTYIKHHQLHVKPVSYHGVTQSGVEMMWKPYPKEHLQELKERLARTTTMPMEQLAQEAKVTPEIPPKPRRTKKSTAESN